MIRKTISRYASMLAIAAALSACGGNGNSGSSGATTDAGAGTGSGTSPATPASGASGASDPSTTVSSKVLVVELDGVTYDALQQGVAAGTLPNLSKLTYAPAYSGGVNGTATQQANLDTPGWASIVTGTWANRHEVYSDASRQDIQAPTMFATLKAANAGLAGVAAGSNKLAALLTSEQNAGYLDALVNCAGVDSCVTQNSLSLIDSGYSLVYAQYHSAQDAALSTGFSTSYTSTIAQLDSALGKLQAEIAKRANERWLVVVTASHGLNAAGGADGLPLLSEATSFVAMNQTPNALLGDTTRPATLASLYTRASIADIAPTVLAYRSASPDASTYAMDGGEMIGDTPVSQLSGTTGSDQASLVLNWVAPASGGITVLRGGQTIATLPAGTATYTDSQLGLTASGTYPFDYTVVAGTAPVSTIASVDYVQVVPPPPLATTLTTGLVSYYPFGALPPVDKLNTTTMAPFQSDANGGTLIADPFGGKGLQVDAHTVDALGYDGYRIAQTTDITAQAQFTLGFWFYTSCTNVAGYGTPVIGNKNYQSGKNPGLAIGLFPGSSATTCNPRFNIADGTTRNDIQSLSITANQWVYVALAIDTTGKTMTAYVFDPVLGEQKASTAVTINLAKMTGLGTGVIGLNEDGTGQYYMEACGKAASTYSGGYTAGACATVPPVAEGFADFALWNRIVTESELQSVDQSGKPLSTLIH